MLFRKKEFKECISYGVVGLFSLAMFVFGVMFPEYTLVNECCNVENAAELSKEQRDKVWELLKEGETGKKRELKVTCLGYEYLKEIIDEWD